MTLTLFLGRTREIWDDCTRVYSQHTHTRTHSRHSIGSAAGATSGGVKRTGGQADGHGHMYRTSLPKGAVSSSSNAACFFTCVLFFLVLLVFCVLCVSILFQMSCVCMRTKTTTATTTTTKDKTRQKRQREKRTKIERGRCFLNRLQAAK